jgi:integrase
MLQGAKRIGEVLSLKWEQVDMQNREINFIQSKSTTKKIITIAYPPYVFSDLAKLCPTKEGFVFTTRTKRPVTHKQIYIVLRKVGVQAGLPFPLTPHCFRASAITYLKGSGYSDSQIQVISGHASNQMVNSYDKSTQKDNISRKISLV